jgi:uncharacterized membrane protein YwzB
MKNLLTYELRLPVWLLFLSILIGNFIGNLIVELLKYY